MIVTTIAMSLASVSQGLHPTNSPFPKRMTRKNTENVARESQNSCAYRVPTVTSSDGALTEMHTNHPLSSLRMMMSQRSENVAREREINSVSQELTAMSLDIASQAMISPFPLSLKRRMMTTQILRHVEN